MLSRSLYAALFSGHNHDRQLFHHNPHHTYEPHNIPEHLHTIKYKTKKPTWHLPNPFKAIK